MVKDAEANAATDKEKIDQIEIKNQAETISYQLNKQIEGLQTPEEKQPFESLKTEFESAISADDYSAMKDLIAKFNELQATANAAQSGAAEGDDAIETDFSAEK